MTNILKEIETKYPVDTILVNGEQVWPYLRMYYHWHYMKKTASEWGEKEVSPPLSQRLKEMPKNSLYGFRNWFGKYDYVALSTTLERKNIDGEYFNKLLDPVIDELGRDKVLYIENPAPSLYPAEKVHTKNIVSYSLLLLLGQVLNMVLRRSCIIQNRSILNTSQKEYGLEIDDVEIIRSFAAERIGFDLLFRRIRPKAILLSCYYGRMPAIKAAKQKTAYEIA